MQPRLRLVRVAKYIRHVVIVVQENRTFDNLFATFPGADGTRYGQMESGSKEVRIELKAVPLDGSATSDIRTEATSATITRLMDVSI